MMRPLVCLLALGMLGCHDQPIKWKWVTGQLTVCSMSMMWRGHSETISWKPDKYGQCKIEDCPWWKDPKI